MPSQRHAKSNTIRIVSDCRIYTATAMDIGLRLARAVARQNLASARIVSRPINATIWQSGPIAIDSALDRLLA